MILIFILYILFASTFTLGKAGLQYVDPILFVGIRMTLGGLLLLGYQYFFKAWRFELKDWIQWVQIIFFHIFLAYVLEFWSLQWITSAKVCLFYNLSPFMTAILSYFFIAHRLTIKQCLGLVIGFLGFLPILMSTAPSEEAVTKHLAFFSLPELALIISAASGAYGWLLMRFLIVNRKYSPIIINGVAMLGGGILALITSFIMEGSPHIKPVVLDTSKYLTVISSFVGTEWMGIIMLCIYTVLLIIISNITCYNLYGYLLTRFSPTFLSFSGLITPLFAALFGWILLGETVSWHFFLTIGIVLFGLYIFYQDELKI